MFKLKKRHHLKTIFCFWRIAEDNKSAIPFGMNIEMASWKKYIITFLPIVSLCRICHISSWQQSWQSKYGPESSMNWWNLIILTSVSNYELHLKAAIYFTIASWYSQSISGYCSNLKRLNGHDYDALFRSGNMINFLPSMDFCTHCQTLFPVGQ